MNDHLRRTIRRRTRYARTKTELVTAIFDSFRHLEIDLQDVSLEDMKIAVVVAARAVRESGGESPLNMPA